MLTTPMNPLHGKICLVTGATGALGAAVVRQLAAVGAQLVLVARDQGRADALRDQVIAGTGNQEIEVLTADLADREELKLLTTRFMGRHARIDLVVHAAGTIESGLQRGADGWERTWATNVLGPYQLTARLTEMLRYCQPSRVIFVASDSAGGLDMRDVMFTKRRYGSWAAYAASQQGVYMLAWAMSAKLAEQGVGVHVVDPGAVRSNSDRPSLLERADGARGLAARLYRRAAGITPEEAARTIMLACADPSLAGATARLIRPGNLDAHSPWRDSVANEALLQLCIRTSRVRPDFDSSVWREDDSIVLDPRALK